MKPGRTRPKEKEQVKQQPKTPLAGGASTKYVPRADEEPTDLDPKQIESLQEIGISELRTAICAELEVKNSRLNRMFTAQTILCAAFGLLFQSSMSQSSNESTFLLIQTVGIIGLCLSLIDIIGITGAYLAVRVMWLEYLVMTEAMPTATRRRAKMLIFKSRSSAFMGVVYSYLLPLSFVALWAFAIYKAVPVKPKTLMTETPLQVKLDK